MEMSEKYICLSQYLISFGVVLKKIFIYHGFIFDPLEGTLNFMA